MIDWIVTYPLQAGGIGIAVAIIYFALVFYLEKKLVQK